MNAGSNPPDDPAANPPTGSPTTGAPGLIHVYQAYDPKSFPSPTAEAPDLAGMAMEHMLAYGNMRDFTPEELARAIRLDPSMIPKLGPSLEALSAMLKERKDKILRRYESDSVQDKAARAFDDSAAKTRRAISEDGDAKLRKGYDSAVKQQQLADIEALWYQQKDEQSPIAKGLMRSMVDLGVKYQIEELASKYTFTGNEAMDIPTALAVKEELEAIDKLLEQLKEAANTAQLAIIDLDELSQFADESQIEDLNKLQKQIEEYVKEEAERQGLEQSANGFKLTPQAYKLFQGRLLSEIFADLEASRSGRHSGPISGDGAVEMARTKQYEFGDSATLMDVARTFVNAMVRESGERARDSMLSPAQSPSSAEPRVGIRLKPEDIEIHLTRNNPKCATAVAMDMSGSMRYSGQYINVKRMALALDALIRREYPGDFLRFIEMATFASVRPSSEVVSLMPKPVSVHSPVVRLRVDMSDPDVSEMRVPQHFTNIQRALQLGRQMLTSQDTPNRQIVLITDGLPTAHYEGSMLYLLYPPDPRTEEATMREAHMCAKEGITINIFLLPSWSQSSEDIAFAQKMAMSTKGRVFFTGGKDLDRFVLWDYVANRRKIIA